MIKVLKSGFSSSIQDLGRLNYREFGVPYSGAMDKVSMEMANLLLGNSKNDAVLEMIMIGATLQFQVSTLIVISGANMSPKLNEKSIKNNKVFFVKENDILSFSAVQSGLYTYLAVKDGFQTEIVLNSRSYYDGITEKATIKDEDILPVKNYSTAFQFSKTNSKIRVFNSSFSSLKIDVFKGPEFHLLSDVSQEKLVSLEFKVSKLYNRMAYQLEPGIKNDLESILTTPVLPGTVQLTPSGQLIVLMRDSQTTGGYPRVLQLSEQAVNILSQKKELDKITFNLVEFP